MGELDQIRARAFVHSGRKFGEDRFTGDDITQWSPYTAVGESVTIADRLRGD